MSEFYINDGMCSKCGGKCCKAMPGSVHPDDLGLPDVKQLRVLLSSGNYAIDWWDGDFDDGDLDRVLYLRPKTKGNENRIFDASWGGECVLLTESGCTLQPKDRPRNCRELEPSEPRCIAHDGSKEATAKAWRPYQEILERLGEEFDK